MYISASEAPYFYEIHCVLPSGWTIRRVRN